MASLPCGQWVNDPDLPMLLDRGLVYQWQSVRGQQPQWVPIKMVAPAAAQAESLDEMDDSREVVQQLVDEYHAAR